MSSTEKNPPNEKPISEAGLFSRRRFLGRTSSALGATVALAGGGVLLGAQKASAQQTPDLDVAILNFALNLATWRPNTICGLQPVQASMETAWQSGWWRTTRWPGQH
jgi:hypothetical protein